MIAAEAISPPDRFSPNGEEVSESSLSGENAERSVRAPLVIDHADALIIAKKVIDALDPYCDEFAIAGDLRRGCAKVASLDFVCLPKSSREGDKLVDRLLRHARMVIMPDKSQAILLAVPRLGGDVRINIVKARHAVPGLFDSDPSNWGIRLMLCTGNASHNIRLKARAEDRGWKLDAYRGITDAAGRVIASATEREIYDALGLPWLEPHERERVSF